MFAGHIKVFGVLHVARGSDVARPDLVPTIATNLESQFQFIIT